jgi:hypothetical protein
MDKLLEENTREDDEGGIVTDQERDTEEIELWNFCLQPVLLSCHQNAG